MQPHDHLFRYVFSQPEHVAGELQCVLRAAIAAQIDWSTLALVPGSFVDSALKELRTDVLFSATLGGQRVLLYVLLEHQSRVDQFMPLRLLAYMVRIWEQERRERPDAKRLPAILPVVVSHDDTTGWNAPTSFAELLDVPRELTGLIRPHMVDFEMVLDDLTQARDDELRGRAMTALARVALFCLQRARGSPDFIAELERWSDILREVVDAPSGVAALGAILRYISHTSQVHPERGSRSQRRGSDVDGSGNLDEGRQSRGQGRGRPQRARGTRARGRPGAARTCTGLQ